jgi:hypothetical protein
VRAAPVKAKPVAAAAVIAAVLILSMIRIDYGNSLPGWSVPPAEPNQTYVSECGSFHTPYHPSLALASSWKLVMAGLDSHFGENAQLNGPMREQISSYLINNSAEHFDTLAANLFRRPDPGDPERTTPAWKRLHRHLRPKVFAAKAKGAPGVCAACHADAESGAFMDQRLPRVPKQDRSTLPPPLGPNVAVVTFPILPASCQDDRGQL